jgi:hypothetical protein
VSIYLQASKKTSKACFPRFSESFASEAVSTKLKYKQSKGRSKVKQNFVLFYLVVNKKNIVFFIGLYLNEVETAPLAKGSKTKRSFVQQRQIFIYKVSIYPLLNLPTIEFIN